MSEIPTRPGKLMAANRGEIAIRIFRAANELGLRTVSIFAEEDRFSIHRFKADEAYPLDASKGPVGAYLDVEGIVALAKQKGVTMIHPGYGFLSENAAFARGLRAGRHHFRRPFAGLVGKHGRQDRRTHAGPKVQGAHPARHRGSHHRSRPGRIELQSGEELHIAAGAEVYGAIRAVGAQDIRITGRGILRQSHLPFGGTGDETHPLELIDCQDAVIDGPTFIDGCTWNVVMRNCDRIKIRHITIFSERPYSTDGINPCDSRDVLVEHCFARCKDDCISIKGLQRDIPVEELKPISNIVVRDCLFWSDNNNGLVVGTETWASEIHDIHFHRTDFVRVSGTCGDWSAAFAVQSLADTYIHDITFDDIDVEYCSGNPFSILYLDDVYGIPGQRRPGGGRIEDITFRNITFHQKPHRHSLILGMDAIRRVSNIRFDSIVSGGMPVTGPSDLSLETNDFSGEITY